MSSDDKTITGRSKNANVRIPLQQPNFFNQERGLPEGRFSDGRESPLCEADYAGMEQRLDFLVTANIPDVQMKRDDRGIRVEVISFGGRTGSAVIHMEDVQWDDEQEE